jgi:hypothetical protein
MNQGCRYSIEGYIKKIETNLCSDGYTAVRAECYASMKKNVCRPMYMIIKSGEEIIDS